ncbi:MAG: hypothetical protein MJ227_02485 [Bacilli bacterium]|nr:hypothetical protein [Bacilli bacterium]
MKRRSVDKIQLWFNEFIEEKSFINLSEASLKDYREALIDTLEKPKAT